MSKFLYQAPLVLVSVAAIVAVAQSASALAPEEIAQRAREFTVRIEGEEQGSGVIIERDGNTYTVLTNWHVVDTKGSYTIVTDDKRQYQVSYDSIRYSPGVDLAILRFTSSQNYPIAERGNSAQITVGSKIYLGGWATPFVGVPESSYTFFTADVVSRLEGSEQGYSILHDNPGTPGTSGGPILDAEARLVGINGRSVANGNTGRAFGLGVPLQTFLSAENNLALPPDVTPPQDFIAAGRLRVNQGDYRGAIAEYSKAIAQGTSSFNAYYERGWVYYKLGEYGKAIADYDQAIRLNPNSALAYNNRGIAYYELGEYGKAIVDYDQAIHLDPNYAIAYTDRGKAYHKLGEMEKAIADHSQAIHLDPNYAIAYYNRGLTHHELGEIGKARKDFQRAANLFQQQGNTELYRRTLDSLRKLQFNYNIWRGPWRRR